MNKPLRPPYPRKLMLRDVIAAIIIVLSILSYGFVNLLRSFHVIIYLHIIAYSAAGVLLVKVYSNKYRNINSDVQDILILMEISILSLGLLFSDGITLICQTGDAVLGSNLLAKILAEHLISADWQIHLIVFSRFIILFPILFLYDSLLVEKDKDCQEYSPKLQSYLHYINIRQKVELKLLQEAAEELRKERLKLHQQEEQDAKEYEEKLDLITMDFVDWQTQKKVKTTK